MIKVLDKSIVYVESSETLNGVLRFQSLDEKFLELSKGLLDKYSSLVHLVDIKILDEIVRNAGMQFEFIKDAEKEYNRQLSIAQSDFVVDSPFFSSGKKLFEFQHYGMCAATHESVHSILLQWDTGAGKTVAGTQIAEKLFQEKRVDIAILLCERIKKRDWYRAFCNDTNRTVKIIDGSRQWRHQEYANSTEDVYVMNFEKARDPSIKGRGKKKTLNWSRTDLEQILLMCRGKRVLLIVDEAQRLGNSTSLIHKGFQRLSKETKAKCIALTATPYVTSPYNVRNIIKLISPETGLAPPIIDVNGKMRFNAGSKQAFDVEYVSEFKYVFNVPIVSKWNYKTLPRLGKRIEKISSLAMKSDPRIARQFPDKVERKIILELSEQDKVVFDYALKLAKESWSENTVSNLAHFNAMRMILNSTESVNLSESQLCKEIRQNKKLELKTENSSKLQSLVNSLESIINQDDKVVIFTFWANAIVPLYIRELKKKFPDTPILLFKGQMSDAELESVNHKFNSSKSSCILIATDAGQKGLNLYAPYLFHLELPYTYTSYKQRRDRIDRVDSKANGITNTWIYRYLYEGTVEERIENKVFRRKFESELITGQFDGSIEQESLSSGELYSLLFG